MRIWLKAIIFIIIIFAVGLSFVERASAAVIFSDISVSDIENGSAVIRWKTNAATRGIVYYGENENDLTKKMEYGLYDYEHELTITGLKKKKTYLYKIVAISELESPQGTESFLQSFSTRNMKKEESVQPTILDKKVVDVVSNAIALRWTTSEPTSAVVYYRAKSEKSYRSSGIRGFDFYHEKVLSGLKPETVYYIKITATDRSGNKSTEYLYTNTRFGEVSKLKIYDIEPLSYTENLVLPTAATIRWKTNRITKSHISYGTSLNRLKTVASDPSPIKELEHEVRLVDLESEKTYYYRITATDYFSNKVSTEIMSFTTPSPRKKVSSGSLVKSSGYKVYVIEGKTKRWVRTAEVFMKLGYKWEWIENVENSFINDYKDGPDIANAKKHPDGTLIKYSDSHTVYVLEEGKKRPISSADSFLRSGFDWSRIITIPKGERYKTGEYL